MRDERRRVLLLGVVCALAGAGSVVVHVAGARWLFAALAFAAPASTPLLVRNHEVGLAVSAGLAAAVAFVAVPLMRMPSASLSVLMVRRSDAVLALRCGSAGAVAGVAWTLVVRRAERVAAAHAERSA